MRWLFSSEVAVESARVWECDHQRRHSGLFLKHGDVVLGSELVDVPPRGGVFYERPRPRRGPSGCEQRRRRSSCTESSRLPSPQLLHMRLFSVFVGLRASSMSENAQVNVPE